MHKYSCQTTTATKSTKILTNTSAIRSFSNAISTNYCSKTCLMFFVYLRAEKEYRSSTLKWLNKNMVQCVFNDVDSCAHVISQQVMHITK